MLPGTLQIVARTLQVAPLFGCLRLFALTTKRGLSTPMGSSTIIHAMIWEQRDHETLTLSILGQFSV
jgi:hypothetical protein